MMFFLIALTKAMFFSGFTKKETKTEFYFLTIFIRFFFQTLDSDSGFSRKIG